MPARHSETFLTESSQRPMYCYCCPRQEAQVPKASGQDEQGCFSTFPPEGTRGGQEVSLESRPEGGQPSDPSSGRGEALLWLPIQDT